MNKKSIFLKGIFVFVFHNIICVSKKNLFIQINIELRLSFDNLTFIENCEFGSSVNRLYLGIHLVRAAKLQYKVMDAKTNKKNARKERREMQKEQMKIYRQQIDELAENDKKSQLAFPPILNNGQRKNLHTYAHGLGLKSKSHGKGKKAMFFFPIFLMNQFIDIDA